MTQPNRAGKVDVWQVGRPEAGWQLRMYTVIFEADTRAGRAFDLTLIAMILASVIVVVLDSMQSVHARHSGVLYALEWTFTILFTIEYIARLSWVRRPMKYARSFFGIIDLLAILPTYMAVLVPGLHALVDVRILRRAVAAARRKILVFLGFVMMVVLVMGTLMYVVEGPEHGYTSIPVGVYCDITTMTTVGFGDITPQTDLGRVIASMMMLLGWGTLAVPTGIVSAEYATQRYRREPTTRSCHECLTEGHSPAAKFCRDCGAKLPPWQHEPSEKA